MRHRLQSAVTVSSSRMSLWSVQAGEKPIKIDRDLDPLAVLTESARREWM